MSNNIDFKALWDNGSKGPVPDASEIFKRGATLQRATRIHLLLTNVMLVATIILISWVGIHFKPEMLTTKIGLGLIIGAILFYMVNTLGYINLLYKSNVDENTSDYLNHLLQIKQKQERLNTTMTTIYFTLLTAGLCLYLIEYAGRGGVVFRVTTYGLTLGWMIFNWVYIHPKMINKQRKGWGAVIKKLEEINGQMGE
ncbi:hypothetical protein ACFGVR_01765 [Mucilaginibacter sp. AW1-3]